MIRAAQADAGRQEWAFVYWQTSQDNHRARLLYDRLTGGETGFVIYQLGTGSEEEIQG